MPDAWKASRKKMEMWWACCIQREQDGEPGHSRTIALGTRKTVRRSDSEDLESRLRERLEGMTKSASIRRHTLFMDHSNQKLSDCYTMLGTIGEGGFGTVQKAHLNNCPGIIRAVKGIRKRKDDLRFNTGLRRETVILRTLDHPNICRSHEVFETENSIYFVMEFIEGHELFDEIKANLVQQKFNEVRYAAIMRQVFSALAYLHEHEVLHRDLKPENIMVCKNSSENEPIIKLVDFGSSVVTTTDSSKSFWSSWIEGTLSYMAPEVHRGDYSPASDAWSAGIIIFVMFSGRLPAKVQLEGRFQFLSESVRELVKGLLTGNPKQRMTAEQALHHPWTAGTLAAMHSEEQMTNFRRSMRSFSDFHACNQLQKAALTALASQLANEDVDALREQFQLIDTDGSGVITKSKLLQAYAKDTPAGVADVPAWVDMIFEELDSDNSGQLEFTEYQAAWLSSCTHVSDQAMRAAFRILDMDQTGTIKLEELARLVDCSKEELLATMEVTDLNGDGVIDFEEFKTMITARARPSDSSPRAQKIHDWYADKSHASDSSAFDSTKSTSATPQLSEENTFDSEME